MEIHWTYPFFPTGNSTYNDALSDGSFYIATSFFLQGKLFRFFFWGGVLKKPKDNFIFRQRLVDNTWASRPPRIERAERLPLPGWQNAGVITLGLPCYCAKWDLTNHNMLISRIQ